MFKKLWHQPRRQAFWSLHNHHDSNHGWQWPQPLHMRKIQKPHFMMANDIRSVIIACVHKRIPMTSIPSLPSYDDIDRLASHAARVLLLWMNFCNTALELGQGLHEKNSISSLGNIYGLTATFPGLHFTAFNWPCILERAENSVACGLYVENKPSTQ